MSKAKSQPERLESLLRRWGAQEAASAAPVAEKLAATGSSAPTAAGAAAPHSRPAWWRGAGWLAGAAAIVGGLYLAYFLGAAQPGDGHHVAATQPGNSPPGLGQYLAPLGDDLNKTRQDLADVRRQLQDAHEKAAGLSLQIQQEQAKSAALAQEVERAKAVAQQRDELAEQLRQLRHEQQNSAIALAEAQKQVERLRETLVASQADVTQLERASTEAMENQRRLRAEMESMRARQETLLARLAGAYLGVEPGLAGLTVRQQAAQKARLLQRLAEVRPAVREASTRQLLARVEVVLTQLQMLDGARPAAAADFANLLRRGDVVGQLTHAVLAQTEPPLVLDWLLEARLVLTGAERVG